MFDRVKHQIHRRNTKHRPIGIKTGESITIKMLPLLRSHRTLIMPADILRSRHQKPCGTTSRITNHIIRRRLYQLHHHLTNMLWRTELTILPRSRQLPQHILIEIPLHIKISNIMLIQIIQPGNDLLQHLRRRNEKHRITHIPSKCRIILPIPAETTGNLDQLSLLCKIRQTAISHPLNSRKNPLGDHSKNITRIIIFELAPTHGLTRRRLRKNPIHPRTNCLLKLLVFQLLLIQRTDKHQIRQLFNNG